MKKSFYIIDNDDNVIAIFTDEDFAVDYLYHLGLDRTNCKIGMLGESVFAFEEHDAKYYMKDSTLADYTHQDCRKFRQLDADIGYCFLNDKEVVSYDRCCMSIDRVK